MSAGRTLALAQQPPALPVGGLDPCPRMAMWSPPDDLAPYISGYHLYVVGETGGAHHRGAFEPASASLRIAVSDGAEWQLRQSGGTWRSPPPVVLLGPTSSVTWSRSKAGILVGAGIRPRGWRRLFAQPAAEWADRFGECPVLGGTTPQAIRERFRRIDDDAAIPRVFNALFRKALGPASAQDRALARIEAALIAPDIETVAQLAEVTHLHVRRLERLALRAFGFPPKLLLRRARFLRSLHAMRAARRGDGATTIDPRYTDYSHFVRDSHDFLGMAPHAFLDIDMPLLKGSLALRKAVLGTPAQVLDAAPAE